MAGEESVSRKAFALKAVQSFFDYETPKLVRITNKRVGVINRLVQLIIIAYIIGYVIIYKKGYQEIDPVVSGTTTKVKGLAYTNFTALNIRGPRNMTYRIWDVADYIIPPQQTDAFFVMTNAVFTPGQTQSKCDEDPEIITCRIDSDCKAGVPLGLGNGVQTGKCVTSSRNSSIRVCEIYAWCPVENDELPVADGALLQGTEDFTVMIKNNVLFPKFGAKSRNIRDFQTDEHFRTCIYDGSHPENRLCPVFRLGSIVNETKSSYKNIANRGGVIKINIDWDCDLDYSIEDCIPVYSFSRLDKENAKVGKGLSFRFANYYDEDGLAYRDLYKAFGIFFIVSVTGQAGKFGFVPLLLNIGSGVGLLAIATVVCDVIALYLLKQGSYYKENKFQMIDENSRTDLQNELVPGTSAKQDDDVPLLDDRTTNA